MAGEDATTMDLLATLAGSERMLASLAEKRRAVEEERRAIYMVTRKYRAKRDAARAALEELRVLHAAALPAGARPALVRRVTQAGAAACVPRALPEAREWPFESLKFVLELRRADGRLLFTAAAQPEMAHEPMNIVKPVTFIGGSEAGDPLRFLKTDTASLFVERAGAGASDEPARVIFLDLPRRRMQRNVRPRIDGAASDSAGHSSDEELAADGDRNWGPSQPPVTRFRSHKLFFCTPRNALPDTFFEVTRPALFHFECFRQTASCCTLECAVNDGVNAAVAVSATLDFRCCYTPSPLNTFRYDSFTPAQLTDLVTKLPSDWPRFLR
jgi:hypothetical protein